MYEREPVRSVNPAFFIIEKVDSCKLPLGKPNTIFFLSMALLSLL